MRKKVTTQGESSDWEVREDTPDASAQFKNHRINNVKEIYRICGEIAALIMLAGKTGAIIIEEGKSLNLHANLGKRIGCPVAE